LVVILSCLALALIFQNTFYIMDLTVCGKISNHLIKSEILLRTLLKVQLLLRTRLAFCVKKYNFYLGGPLGGADFYKKFILKRMQSLLEKPYFASLSRWNHIRVKRCITTLHMLCV
jgi:hypothetical protein